MTGTVARRFDNAGKRYSFSRRRDVLVIAAVAAILLIEWAVIRGLCYLEYCLN